MKVTLNTYGGLTGGVGTPPVAVDFDKLDESAQSELRRLVAAATAEGEHPRSVTPRAQPAPDRGAQMPQCVGAVQFRFGGDLQIDAQRFQRRPHHVHHHAPELSLLFNKNASKSQAFQCVRPVEIRVPAEIERVAMYAI